MVFGWFKRGLPPDRIAEVEAQLKLIETGWGRDDPAYRQMFSIQFMPAANLEQLASMNVHIFTTGEGSPYGLPMVPVIKISSRTALAERWPDLIDIDAGTIATGAATIEDVGWQIFRFVLDVASGKKKTWAEHWGLQNALVPFGVFSELVVRDSVGA